MVPCVLWKSVDFKACASRLCSCWGSESEGRNQVLIGTLLLLFQQLCDSGHSWTNARLLAEALSQHTGCIWLAWMHRVRGLPWTHICSEVAAFQDWLTNGWICGSLSWSEISCNHSQNKMKHHGACLDSSFTVSLLLSECFPLSLYAKLNCRRV